VKGEFNLKKAQQASYREAFSPNESEASKILEN